jgi:hypothetical protein
MNPMINNGISSVSMVLGLMNDLMGTAFVLHRNGLKHFLLQS